MMTWEQVSWRLGRNELPHALAHAYWAQRLTDLDELAKGVEEAWTIAEFPMMHLRQTDWLDLFAAVGFLRNEYREGPHAESVAVYRGSTPGLRRRWSWTEDLERAQWFATTRREQGQGDAVVWTATIPPGRALANFTQSRKESEWVFNPVGVKLAQLPET